MDDFAVNIGESKIATGVPIRQAGVIKAEQVQNCGMKVVDVYLLFHRLKAKFVGCAVHITALHPATGQEGGKAMMIVVAAVAVEVIGQAHWDLDGWGTSELAAADDERILQHASLFEILQQCPNGLIALLCK